jgi:hypothetical protein
MESPRNSHQGRYRRRNRLWLGTVLMLAIAGGVLVDTVDAASAGRGRIEWTGRPRPSPDREFSPDKAKEVNDRLLGNATPEGRQEPSGSNWTRAARRPVDRTIAAFNPYAAAATRAKLARGEYQVEIMKLGTGFFVYRLTPPPSRIFVPSSAELPAVFNRMVSEVANDNRVSPTNVIVRRTGVSDAEMEGLTRTLAANPYRRFENERGEDATFQKRTRDGRITRLKLLGRSGDHRLYQPLRWSEATITEATISHSPDTRVVGDPVFSSKVVVDLTIPVVPQWNSGDFPLSVRVYAFFRRLLIGSTDVDAITSNVKRVIGQSKDGSIALHGFLELKADLMKMGSSRPDAVRFSLEEGIILGRREDGILDVRSD